MKKKQKYQNKIYRINKIFTSVFMVKEIGIFVLANKSSPITGVSFTEYSINIIPNYKFFKFIILKNKIIL